MPSDTGLVLGFGVCGTISPLIAGARLERARQIGLFRYMLIREAADPTLSSRQRGKLVRQLAAVPHTDPDGRTVRISRWTLDRWIWEWQRAGFEPRGSRPESVGAGGCDPRRPPGLLGRLEEARDRLDRALTLYQEWAYPGHRRDVARTGPGRAGRWKPRRGSDLAETALAIATDTRARRFEPGIRNALGTVCRHRGRLAEAIDHHSRARTLAWEASSSAAEVQPLTGLATAYADLGQTAEAHECATAAVAQRTGYRLLEGQAATALARLMLASGRTEDAIVAARRALRIHEETGHRLGEAYTHRLLGQAHDLLREPSQARRHWRQALVLYTAIGTPEAEEVRNALAARADGQERDLRALTG